MNTRMIPLSVQQFIQTATVCQHMHLPFHYPALHEVEGYQSGFRRHGITGADLTGMQPGQWQPGWYVIALNGFDDPFFVDITEEEKGLPVYYAEHGAGKWEAIKIAETLVSFSQILTTLQALQQNEEATISWLEANTDTSTDFWKELLSDLKAAPEQPEETPAVGITSWKAGKIMITHIGPEKIKVVNYLKNLLQLTPQEALELSRQKEIVAAEGYGIRLERIKNDLQKLGATTVFVPEEEQK
jgi:hypothetical protein